jgi:hypothetical protein
VCSKGVEEMKKIIGSKLVENILVYTFIFMMIAVPSLILSMTITFVKSMWK